MSYKYSLLPLVLLLGLSGCSVEKEQQFQIPEKESVIIGNGEVIQENHYIGYIEPIESSSV